MSILDNEEKIMNQSDWLVERGKVYMMINHLRDDQQHMMERMNWLENEIVGLKSIINQMKSIIEFRNRPNGFTIDPEYMPTIRF